MHAELPARMQPGEGITIRKGVIIPVDAHGTCRAYGMELQPSEREHHHAGRHDVVHGVVGQQVGQLNLAQHSAGRRGLRLEQPTQHAVAHRPRPQPAPLLTLRCY